MAKKLSPELKQQIVEALQAGKSQGSVARQFRVSVGIEDSDDLLDDFCTALEGC